MCSADRRAGGCNPRPARVVAEGQRLDRGERGRCRRLRYWPKAPRRAFVTVAATRGCTIVDAVS